MLVFVVGAIDAADQPTIVHDIQLDSSGHPVVVMVTSTDHRPGPQRGGTGGEVAVWTSQDRGRTWTKTRDVPHYSPQNHRYVRRPVDAAEEFYARDQTHASPERMECWSDP